MLNRTDLIQLKIANNQLFKMLGIVNNLTLVYRQHQRSQF